MAAKAKDKQIRIRQIRSSIGASPKQAAALQSLGLGRIGTATERAKTANLDGQIRLVSHLVETEEVS